MDESPAAHVKINLFHPAGKHPFSKNAAREIIITSSKEQTE
ncbi:MAG TPA: hypothetical protein VJY43_04360 [Methanocorpusculum sp.]|nr:hypothetical protein [Methanocorpusculum sp.]